MPLSQKKPLSKHLSLGLMALTKLPKLLVRPQH